MTALLPDYRVTGGGGGGITVGAHTIAYGLSTDPVGTLPTRSTGDLLIAWLFMADDAAISTPTGWTDAGSLQSPRGHDRTLARVIAEVDGAEVAPDWGTLSTSEQWTVITLAIAGADTSVASQSTLFVTSVNSTSQPSNDGTLTASSGDLAIVELIFQYGNSPQAGQVAPTEPSGTTVLEIGAVNDNEDDSSDWFGLAYVDLTGNPGTLPWTIDVASTRGILGTYVVEQA